jgi:outer membrane protein assembly factor BamB
MPGAAYLIPLLLLTLSLGGRPSTPPAEQWPDFRGPAGDGHALGKGLPLTWGEGRNVRWKLPVPGKAWSSPVAWGNRIWLTTATEDGRSMSALCVDRGTGRVLLNRVIFTNTELEEHGPGHEANSYASPTPVLDPDRVYLHYGKYGTACLDARTFKNLWRRRDLLCTHSAGPGSSPVLWRDRLILTYDGIDRQFLAALDVRTGRTVWTADRALPWESEDVQQRKAFSTPFVTEWQGGPLLLTSGAKAARAYDPATGRELWRVTYKGFSNVARPLAGHGFAYLNTGYQRAELLAVRLGGSGDVTQTHVAWQLARNVPLNPSPLLVDGLLYLINQGGILTCVDARTGEEAWKERVDGPFSASPIFADGRIYLFNESGLALVVAPGRAYRELARNRLDDGLMGSPAVVGRSLIVRTRTHLYCLESAP